MALTSRKMVNQSLARKTSPEPELTMHGNHHMIFAIQSGYVLEKKLLDRIILEHIYGTSKYDISIDIFRHRMDGHPTTHAVYIAQSIYARTRPSITRWMASTDAPYTTYRRRSVLIILPHISPLGTSSPCMESAGPNVLVMLDQMFINHGITSVVGSSKIRCRPLPLT